MQVLPKAPPVVQNSVALTSLAPPDQEGGLQLDQVVQALRRQILLIAGITTLMIGAAGLKVRTATPVYRASFEILTEPVTVETEVLSSLPQTLSSRQQEQLLAGSSLDATKIRVLQSPEVLAPVVAQLKNRYPEMDYATLIGHLAIQVDPSSKSILQVSYSDPNERLVGTFLNLLSETYLQYSLDDRQQDIRQGIAFVDEQIPILENQVSRWQDQLQKFREQYNLIDPDSQAELLSKQIGVLSQDLIETQTQLNQTKLLYQQLGNALGQPEQAGASPLIDSPRYQKLLDQLLEIDSQLAQDSALYLENSPELNLLIQQRQSLLPLLQQEGYRVGQQVASYIQELQDREQSLHRSILAANQQIKQLSAVTREYTDIQRELNIATDNLTQFLGKREGLRIDASQRQLPWRLLTAPSDPVRTSANAKRTLALGTILGLLLGTGAALVVDKLKSVLHTTKDVKDLVNLPILGVIPTCKLLPELDASLNADFLTGIGKAIPLSTRTYPLQLISNSALDQPLLPFLETFRMLAVGVRLISPDQPIRSLTISSPGPASGKTTVALYLAQAAASMGQRVLLIDADLRRPSLQQRLNLAQANGLTDVVAGRLEYEQAIQKISADNNLYFLPAGSIPPDSTRVLASQAMQQVIEKSQAVFDLVIYDVPPLLGFADAHLLCNQTDGVLLVARLGHLKRSQLELALEHLRIASTPVWGLVINDSTEKLPDSYDYYRTTHSS
ncbi:MAG: GumC family protein [Elainella sp.]